MGTVKGKNPSIWGVPLSLPISSGNRLAFSFKGEANWGVKTMNDGNVT